MTPSRERRSPHAAAADQDAPLAGPRLPLYPRLLGLRYVRLRPWHRALLAEGSLAVAVLLTLADLATAWTLLVLPLAVAALVKLHDVVAGLLGCERPRQGPARTARRNADGAGPRGEPAPQGGD